MTDTFQEGAGLGAGLAAALKAAYLDGYADGRNDQLSRYGMLGPDNSWKASDTYANLDAAPPRDASVTEPAP